MGEACPEFRSWAKARLGGRPLWSSPEPASSYASWPWGDRPVASPNVPLEILHRAQTRLLQFLVASCSRTAPWSPRPTVRAMGRAGPARGPRPLLTPALCACYAGGFCFNLPSPGAVQALPRVQSPGTWSLAISCSLEVFACGIFSTQQTFLFPPQGKILSRPGPSRRNWWQPPNSASSRGTGGTPRGLGPTEPVRPP